MVLDSRILLGSRPPNVMGAPEMLDFQNMMRRSQLSELELQQARQQAQGRNMFSKLAQDPASFDPTGNLTHEAFRQFAGVDPASAIELRNRMLQEQQTRSAIERNVSQARAADALAAKREQERRVGVISPVMRSTLLKYDEAMQRTGDIAAA